MARKRVQRAKAKPDLFSRVRSAIRREPRFAPTGEITRREFLVRGAIGIAALGATALGSEYIARHKIPYWAGAEHRENLSLAFVSHEKKSDAKALVDAMVNARKKGKPYHLLFFENAIGLRESEMSKVRDETIRGAKKIRDEYNRMLAAGIPHETILARLQPVVKSLFDRPISDFNTEIILQCALNNIRMLPVEYYSREDSRRLSEFSKTVEQLMKDREEIIKRGRDLLELQKHEMRFGENMSWVSSLREKRIGELIESGELFRTAKELYPELGKEKEIRAIGFLGGSHREVYQKLIGKKNKSRN